MSGRKSDASWQCPNCLRTVPGRVTTCYCGVERGQIDDQARPQADGARGNGWLVSTLAAALGGGLLVTSLERPEPSPAAPVSTPSAASASTQPPQRPIPVTFPSFVAAATPEPAPVSRAPRAPAPRIEPRPDPVLLNAEAEQAAKEVDSVSAMREEGVRRLDSALAALGPKVQGLESKIRTYGEGCTTTRSALARGGCPTLKGDILRLLAEIQQTVSEIEQEARRSWVAPGTLRDLLRKHGLDAGSRARIVAASDRALTGSR